MSPPLTPTEQAILAALLAGKRCNEIARERGCHHANVKRHVGMIRAKAGVRTMVQLGAWAERHGIREQGAQP